MICDNIKARKYRKCPECGHKWPLNKRHFLISPRTGKYKLKCWRCSPGTVPVLSMEERASNQAYIWSIKARSSCIFCNESKTEVLVFHHRDPKLKLFALARAAGNGRTREEIDFEIGKCDLLCANCHLSLHYWARQMG